MKKNKLIALLLAVITVMQVFPVFALPIIAEDDIEGLSSDDMEVGKLYRAKFSSDTFVPYGRFPFVESPILKLENVPNELVVIRQSADDYNMVYVTEDTSSWPSDYSEYRYVNADKLTIGEGISVDAMTIGQVYLATWDTADDGVFLYKKIPASEAEDFVEYGFSDSDIEPFVSTDGFPSELIVRVEYENDSYVQVTNENWPKEFEQYRYVDPEYDLVLLGEYVDDGYIHGKVDISCDEAVGGVVTLEKGGKTHAFTKLDAEISDNAKYQWQMKLPDGRWAAIMDYILPYAVLSEALLVNNMAEDGVATLRCIVTDGDKQYASDELGLTLAKDSPIKMMAAAPRVEAATPAIASRSIDANTPAVAAEEEEFPVTIRYVFARLNENHLHTEAAHPYTHPLYDESQVLSTIVPSPFVMGYTACVLTDNATHPDVIPFDGDGDKNVEYYLPQSSWEFQNITLSSSADERHITIYYVPLHTNFVVEHYYQNLNDDGYSLAGMDLIKTKYCDDPVGEGLARNAYGYKPLFYDATTKVAGNGNTVIEIYYDRIYYLVDFELSDGYGLMPYYVRYGAQVMLTEPTRPGYSFVNPWQLDRVYTKKDDDDKVGTSLDLNDQNISAAYKNKNANALITVEHNLNYTANWKEEEASFAIVYWKENANDNSYSCWGVQTVTGHSPGDVVTVDGTNIPEDIHKGEKNYFTYNPVLSDTQVTVKGDGSAVANVYYYRNIYTLTFTANGLCNIPEGHAHADACYDYICNSNNHVHDDNCTLICTIEEHKHDPVGCNCTVIEHTHTGDCCTIDEHTHVANCCSIEEHTHGASCLWGYICSKNEHTHGDGNCNYTCGETAHTHGNGNCNYTCGETAHKHGDGNCNYTCGETAHIHDASCYDCGEDLHEHVDACKRLICAIPQNHTHNSACNSTNSSSTVAMITGKYGSDIRSKFPIKGRNDNSFAGYWWLVPNESNFLAGGKNIVSLDQIPGENLTFTGSYKGTNAVIYYYIEVLPGESYVENLPGSGDRKYALYKEVITVRDGYLTEKEEFHAIEGFTTGYASGLYYPNNIFNSTVAAENYLYYTRNSKTLQFYSNNVHLSDLDETVLYGASMSSYASVVPSYPAAFEKNAYEFAGWYTTPGCYDGTEYDFDTETMPDQNVLLYAKWVPTTHNVTVYRQESEKDSTETGKLLLDKTVEFGTQIHESELATYTKPNENYAFGGWFYRDENGEEHRYDFNTMVVKRSYVIYAKWIKNVPIPYTVKYVAEINGEKIEIAKTESGIALEGVKKTFTAKTDTDLYEDYRMWYFPDERYITHEMKANEAENVIEFVYHTSDTVTYTVTHVFNNDKFADCFADNRTSFTYSREFTITKGFDGENGKFQPIIVEAFTDIINKDAITKAAKDANATDTEAIWLIILSLTPDFYIQEMLLTKDAHENVMTFVWEDAKTTAMYQVVHYVQNLGSIPKTYSIFNTETYYVKNDPDLDISAKWANMYGYTRAAFKISGEAQSSKYLESDDIKVKLGEDVPMQGKILELYYDRAMYTYTVHHYAVGTTKELADDETYTEEFETEILTEKFKKPIEGYTYYVDNVPSHTLGADNYEIIVFYSPETVNYHFQHAVAGRGDISLPQYTGKVGTAPDPDEASSTATPLDGYRFVGWFLDTAGTQPVTQYAELSEDGMTITPRTPTPDMANQTITFYALFEPTTRTFKNSGVADKDADQAFIYRIQGLDSGNSNVDVTFVIVGNDYATLAMLPFGKYKVTVTDWAWRYNAPTVGFNGSSKPVTETLTLNTTGDVTFTYGAPKNQWLTSDDSALITTSTN